jgi:acyl carrier protein
LLEIAMSGRDDELIDIIAEEALIDRAKLDPAAKLEDIGLDSVDLVSVVFAIEEKYGIEIAEDARPHRRRELGRRARRPGRHRRA